MYNMYDDDDIEMKEEQLIYYIDEKEEDAIQEEETELPEITEDYLKVQEKLSNDEKELILFKDSKNKIYEGKVIGHSTKNDGKFLFSVIEYDSSVTTPINKIFSVSKIVLMLNNFLFVILLIVVMACGDNWFTHELKSSW